MRLDIWPIIRDVLIYNMHVSLIVLLKEASSYQAGIPNSCKSSISVYRIEHLFRSCRKSSSGPTISLTVREAECVKMTDI